MNKCSVVSIIAIFALVVGCASTKQYVKLPDQSVGLENPGMARIYIARPSVKACSVAMEVMDNATDIGVIGPKGYLCWERYPGEMRLVGITDVDDAFTDIIQIKSGYVYYFRYNIHQLYDIRHQLDQVSGSEGMRILGSCNPPRVAR